MHALRTKYRYLVSIPRSSFFSHFFAKAVLKDLRRLLADFFLEAKIAVTFVGDRTLERQGRPESHEGKKGQKDQKGRGMPTELGG